MFLKAGADAPENFLAYDEFDGDFKADGEKDELVKNWDPHVRDWNRGDPTWADGKGKGIIGAVNYLASQGMNAFSFLTLNIGGDDRNAYPYTSYDERRRLDVSRLAQWEIVFEHGTSKGMFLHFKTQETENETLLDGGETGPERRLYYRELIARFGHHPALNWNLGEENGEWGKKHKKGEFQSKAERLAMADYFKVNDPYSHPVVIHNGQWFDDLYGEDSPITGASLQTNREDFANVHKMTKRILRESAAKGRQWIVACDEPGDATHSLIPDAEDPERFNARTNALWGVFTAGGWGIEWYFGYKHPHSDLTCQDYRSRELMWQQSRYALDFFRDNKIPVAEMDCHDDLLGGADGFCLAAPGNQYVVLIKDASKPATLDLKRSAGEHRVQWFNPRTGGQLQAGTIESIRGPGVQLLGQPPAETDADWVVLVTSADQGVAASDRGVDADVVVIEAESTESDLGAWQVKNTVEGFSDDGYLEFTGNTPISGPADSPLEYAFTVASDGLYYLHLHCAREKVGDRNDLANDAYVRLQGDFNCGPKPGGKHGDDAPLKMLKHDTKFFGGADRTFEWAGGNRLDPGGHNNKRVAVYQLKAGQPYTLVVSGRSQLFKLDKIAFRHADVSADALK